MRIPILKDSADSNAQPLKNRFNKTIDTIKTFFKGDAEGHDSVPVKKKEHLVDEAVSTRCFTYTSAFSFSCQEECEEEDGSMCEHSFHDQQSKKFACDGNGDSACSDETRVEANRRCTRRIL